MEENAAGREELSTESSIKESGSNPKEQWNRDSVVEE